MPDRLDRAEVPPAVLEIVRVLGELGHAVFLVGGAVRDLVRGDRSEATDWDVATSATPDRVTSAFRRVFPTGIAHGTVTVVIDGTSVEVTTFRGEGAYSDGRHPDTVEFLDDIEADLARRDFTINALAWNPDTGEFHDPFGGLDDLEGRVVRAVGDPAERFAEDGLRAMRAVRFASVLGFELDPATLAALSGSFDSFRKVAVERIQAELSKLLLGPQPSRGVSWMERSGLLAVVLPGLSGGRDWSVLDRLDARLGLRLAALLSSLEATAARDGCERLRFSRAICDQVGRLLGEPPDPGADSSGPAMRRVMARVGAPDADELARLWRALAETACDPTDRADALAREVSADPPVTTGQLALTGEDVMKLLATGPGPRVGEVLRGLLERVLDDPSLNRRETLVALLEEF